MKVTLEPGPKQNQVFLPLPDPILQYLGWKGGDEIENEIHVMRGQKALVIRRAERTGF